MTVNLIVCSRWRAPEYEFRKISGEVDVYSYGLLLFEVVSGGRVSWPYRGFRRDVPFIIGIWIR